ncbi:glycoside hydrolase family 15 protein [Baudoinia panamericana UAMH 10762]|uniref:glucan 1,4-alpha-glucosidase n=1 Tax=Baudoinia panamericana (strain UAMH 10762) TaxID=717646 RepID=M2M7Q1_BAUPA|nr:glycoside hydrolase family 15 protein [Baudoinia panamericana UAMH 10762]EMC92356.1 glycoside hydrolase family 15 protein [Baudoinia panamericana UAMH 10762]
MRPKPSSTWYLISLSLVVAICTVTFYLSSSDLAIISVARMRSALASILAGTTFAATTLGQACQTTTLTSSAPTDGSELALQSYSYCGGTLNATVYIANLDYNKVVSLYYTNAQGLSTPLSVVTFGYSSSIANNFELWTTSTPVYIDGITTLLNLTYQATDIGETYVQTLNLPVNASGAPAPSVAAPPKPYATPRGFGGDITTWLSVNTSSESETAFRRMFLNINPAIPGAAEGVVVAARSGPSYTQTDPDYEYNWVRDASLTMDVVQTLYASATKKVTKLQYEDILFQYATARATEQNDPGLQTGLGEPKFYLNNTIFSGPWGRPQNDGPATSAITLMEFATSYLANGGSMNVVQSNIYDSATFPTTAPVKKDLLFVASNWSSSSFDLWEEEESDHFYTRMVQRRALVMGAAFANTMGDSSTSATLSAAATALTATLSQFWDPNRQILLYEYGPVLHDKSSYLDIAVILGVIHGYAADNVYSYSSDQIMASALRISTSFLNVFPIANTTMDSNGLVLGIPIGRYPEDVYNGTGTAANGGNPWYLCTAAMSQYMYSLSSTFGAAQAITVTNVSKPFFDYFAPQAGLQTGETYTYGTQKYNQAIGGINGWGDAFMRTVKYYTPADGRLAEEFNRNTVGSVLAFMIDCEDGLTVFYRAYRKARRISRGRMPVC